MAALKAILASLDGLDETTAKLYKQGEDKKFYLEVEGLVDKGKLDTFRDNNIALTEQVKKLTEDMAKFSGIDPEKYKAAMQAIESDVEKKLMKDGKIDEVFALRTEKMRQSYEDQLKAKDAAIAKAADEATKATGERNTYIVGAELQKAVDNPDFGFQAGVVDLIKEQVLKEFAYKDGKVIRVKPDGSPVFGAKGDHATISEYLAEIVKDRAYLVKQSNGSGARNNGSQHQQNGSKSMKRSEFDAIGDPIRKATLMKEGYELVD